MKFRLGSLLVGLSLSTTALAQVTQRVSVSSAGAQGYDDSGDLSSISPDGRYVAFESEAPNFVSGDTNGSTDVFVRDRQSGTTERISVDSAGAQANAISFYPSISADGRYVAFWSRASNLVPGDTSGWDDIFVRDRQLGTTERVSVSSAGSEGNGPSYTPSISADGRFVVFPSWATNLVAGDTNAHIDIFVRDRQLGTTEFVSISSGGVQGNSDSLSASISADGRYVAFESSATNLIPGDTNSATDVFVRDLQTGTTERVSVDSTGAQGVMSSDSPSISADGRFVAFKSSAGNLVPGDTNGCLDVFVRDRLLGTTERVSLDSAGAQGNGSSYEPSISADGLFVSFDSSANNLVPGDSNGSIDVFVRSRQSGLTECVSLDPSGASAGGESRYASISNNGRYVAFQSLAWNLVPGDTLGNSDIFVRDRQGAPNFTSLCDPGTSGVLPCPCSNPSSGAGRGCDNSSNTGGAVLAASGGTYLSSDSLWFTTSGERPSALSIVTQWSGTNAMGQVFGMGVRCTSGMLKRLYTKIAAGGSIAAPNFGAGDPQVSVRSAALGDTILSGQSRWYLVYYRDPNVLGGCPASSTFNCTQTGQVTWSP